jgi:lipopolysaccharide transport system ATP-binding protein
MNRREISRRFDEIVSFSEIDGFIDTPVKRYSSGMYVRLAFGVAAHLEPDILIVDEVLAVGDLGFQKKCLGKMGSISRTGRTVLIVSHNMAAIGALCSSCLLLNRGRIEGHGLPDEMISQFVNSMRSGTDSATNATAFRHGTRRPKHFQVHVLSESLEPSTTVAAGQPLIVAFHFPKPLREPRMVFALYNQYGHLIADFDTGILSAADSVPDRVCTDLRCRIPEMTLLPGEYRMNVALSLDGQMHEHVEGALFIDVDEGCLRGRPVLASHRGAAVIPHTWEYL